jgi:hypothetical protein
MASKTGWVSVIDPLIDERISPVAVCCSSASLVSLNRRTFSIAITAWPAKVLSNSIWCAPSAPAAWRTTEMAPIATPSRSIGTTVIAR